MIFLRSCASKHILGGVYLYDGRAYCSAYTETIDGELNTDIYSGFSIFNSFGVGSTVSVFEALRLVERATLKF